MFRVQKAEDDKQRHAIFLTLSHIHLPWALLVGPARVASFARYHVEGNRGEIKAVLSSVLKL